MPDNKTEFSANMNPAEETLQPFDVRDSSGRQGMVKLAIGFGILLFLAFAVLKLYQPGVRDRGDPPRITADNTPFKVAPEEAGGKQTPDQDKAVFDVMDGQKPVETITPEPEPEEPAKLPETVNIQVKAPAIETADPKPASPAQSEPEPVTTAPPKPAASVGTGNSEYVVQVASVRSEAEAQRIWQDVRRKYPNIVTSDFYADVRRVDLDEKGIYYRTRLAGLADKDAATQMCNALKGAGQACFVTRK